jgi:hypothetical protein
MDRRVGKSFVENVPASMTKCAFCCRYAHRGVWALVCTLISVPDSLVLKGQEGSGFAGSMEKENFITNLDKELYVHGELSGRRYASVCLSVYLSVCRDGTIRLQGPALTYLIDYRVLWLRPTRLHRCGRIFVVLDGVSRSRAATKLDTGIASWESTTPTRKKQKGRKRHECCILGFIPSLSPHLESHDLLVLPGHLPLCCVEGIGHIIDVIRKSRLARGTADADDGSDVRVLETFEVCCRRSSHRALCEIERNWVGGSSGKTRTKMQKAKKKQSRGSKGWSYCYCQSQFLSNATATVRLSESQNEGKSTPWLPCKR